MRPRRSFVFAALLILFAATGEAQLYGLRNPGDGGRQLVTVDPATAAVTPISASISPPLPSASGVAALDAAGQRFFFIAPPASETDSRIYTVDTATGAVLHSPTLAGSALAPFHSIEFDTDSGVLYGLRNPAMSATKELVTIDPVTAAVTSVGVPVGGTIGVQSGVAAIDSAGNRYFFTGAASPETDFRIYTFDTATGALLSSPLIPGSGSQFFMGLDYDEAEDVLYGVRNPGDGGRQLVALDPATGTVTPIGASFMPPCGSSSGITALDEGGNRAFFICIPSSETDYRLVTVDTATGALLHGPTITGSASAFFMALAYPPPAGPPPVLAVTIDIRPASINPRSRGVIPVAILTTPTFDATTVDVATVRFGPGAASEAHGTGHLEDVDGDGDPDLMLHFATHEAAIPCGATSATLTGQTTGGQPITGSDTFKTSGCK